VENYSDIARPLLAALRKDGQDSFVWTDDMQAAMAMLVDKLTSQPALALPDPPKPYTILTDASDAAVGALLRQGRILACDSAL
jgi:hypothetical protein